MVMTEKEKMLSGELFCGWGNEIEKDYMHSKKLAFKYNKLPFYKSKKHAKIIKKWFGKIGENFAIASPFVCEFGQNIEADEYFYVNSGCCFLDVCKISFGKNVLVGPNTSIYTASHPMDAETRRTGLAYGKPVKIGNDVWIGGSVVILGGVTIGDNVIVGAGSVVTHDLEKDGIYAGNPARLIRKLDM